MEVCDVLRGLRVVGENGSVQICTWCMWRPLADQANLAQLNLLALVEMQKCHLSATGRYGIA